MAKAVLAREAQIKTMTPRERALEVKLECTSRRRNIIVERWSIKRGVLLISLLFKGVFYGLASIFVFAVLALRYRQSPIFQETLFVSKN